MEAFINVIREDPKVSVKVIDMLDRYMRLPYKISIRNKRSFMSKIFNHI